MRKKIVFIGNSIVNGFPFKRSQCFVSLVRQDSGMDVINKGNNGETTGEILARFAKDALDHRPDLIFVLTGTNDFIYGEGTPPEVLEKLRQMADLCQDFAPPVQPVFLTPLPVDAEMASRLWMAGAGVDYRQVNRRLEELAALICESELESLDTGRLYKNCGKYHDGVHPLPEGHRFLADHILDWLKEQGQL